jgi:hypothetical protein
VLFGLEWLGRHHAHPLQLPSMNQAIQGAAIVVGLFSIALLGAERGVTFVYFQF